jgi:benzylsuccinate CoA-transferase BbsF subunit
MERSLPLRGVKVLEWTTVINGPTAGRCFSDFGAEVIKIESTITPDNMRVGRPYKDNIPGPDRAPYFVQLNTGKKSFTLNLKKPRGLEIFKKLVSWADIVLQNQRPGRLEEMSLGYNELRKIKEDIILLDGSIVGQVGPLVGEVGGFAGDAMAQSGQSYYYRFPGGEPLTPGFTGTTDVIGPLYIAMAGIVALDHRNKTGKGQHIDLTQIEPVVHFLGPAILDYTVNHRIMPPVGNRDRDAAPHNAFRCQGDDKWCAIAVFTDEEWKGFCRVLGEPEWTSSPKFATLSARKENEDELEKLVNRWTIHYTPKEVMTMMQEAGVSAGIVQSTEDIVDFDLQVRARKLLPVVHHPVIGDCLHIRWPFILSKTPEVLTTAPCLGEHNHQVCTEILDMSDDEFVRLLDSGVLT